MLWTASQREKQSAALVGKILIYTRLLCRHCLSSRCSQTRCWSRCMVRRPGCSGGLFQVLKIDLLQTCAAQRHSLTHVIASHCSKSRGTVCVTREDRSTETGERASTLQPSCDYGAPRVSQDSGVASRIRLREPPRFREGECFTLPR